MKMHKMAGLLVVAGLAVVGCDEGKGAGPEAKGSATAKATGAATAKATGQAASTAAATGTAAASAAATGAPSAAPTATADAPAGGSSYAAGDVVKYMPKDCDAGRVFVNLGKFMGYGGANAAAVQAKLLSMAGDPKVAKGLDALKAGGFDPAKSLKEVAICATKNDDNVVVAVGMDAPTKPGNEVIEKFFEAIGEKANKKEEGGATFFTNTKGDRELTLAKPTVLLITGKGKSLALAKGGDGAGEFQQGSNVIWAKIIPGAGESVDVTLAEAGANLDLTVGVVEKRMGDKLKKDAAGEIKKAETELKKMSDGLEKSPFKPAAEVLKALKITAEGDKLVVKASVPSTVLADLMKAVADAKPEDLKGMRF
jgi:hypothetical protein